MLQKYRIQILCGVIVGVGACSGGGSGGDADPAMGAITLAVTDTPVEEAAEVVIQFSAVEIKSAEDTPPEMFLFTTPRQIDLLAQAGGASEVLLLEEAVPAGIYEWVRFYVDASPDASDSYIRLLDGSVHPFFIPSNDQTGVKLEADFVIGAGGTSSFTIDFDLRQSVLRPPGLAPHFLFKPRLRLVNNLEVGSIEGEVAAAIAAENCSAVVYVYEGAGVIPDDLGSPTAPLTSAPVEMDIETGAFLYRAAFLPVGDYTAALTCEANLDEAESDEDIVFLEPQDATVTAGAATTVNFTTGEPAPPPGT
ncbi:MAG: DUF4382 domain-containing protein [Steroidobacteraceae bacterium]